MSNSTSHELTPGAQYTMAIGGLLLTGLFNYAAYSSQHKTAYKVAFVMGAMIALVVQASLMASETAEDKPKIKVGPLALFGYLIPFAVVLRLGPLILMSRILPPSWLRVTPQDISRRGLNVLSGISLGYSATNAICESYHFYRS